MRQLTSKVESFVWLIDSGMPVHGLLVPSPWDWARYHWGWNKPLTSWHGGNKEETRTFA